MTEDFIYSQKNSFSGGELTPTIEGRSELGLYQNGVKKLINFLILPSGGIMRRPGTKFMHLFEDNVPKKMVNVVFSRELSYLLVFESHNLYTTCSFFVEGELFVNRITLKDRGHDFHFKLQDFSYCCYQGIAYISFGSKRPIFKFSVDVEVTSEFYQHIKQKAKERQQNNRERPEIALAEAFADSSSFNRRDQMFIIEEMSALVNYFKNSDDQSSDAKQKPFNEVIYNAQIDEINAELKSLHDAAGQNIYENHHQHIFASHVVTFASRLWCFGVNDNIHGIWASYKGDFADFRMAYKTLLEARNPLSAFSSTFSSATFDNILWVIAFANELLIGSTDGIYLASEGDRAKGEFIKIHKEIDISVSQVKPVVLGKTIFFVEGNNCKINSLYYSREKGGYQISNITHYSEHIFSCGISQLTGSNTPFSIVFAVLKNGSFATFTYSEDLKIMGWSQHWLGGGGFILSITSIMAEGEDRLYFHVRRGDDTGVGAKEYLEVLNTSYFTAKTFETGKPVYADCHVNVNCSGEHIMQRNIQNSINDNSAHEFRGSITKLEEIIKLQAQGMLRLNMETINVGESFKYDNRLVNDYANIYDPLQIEELKEFIVRYYNDYLPKINEILAISFALYRQFTNIYAELESLFYGGNDAISKIEKLLYDGERFCGDLAEEISNIQHWKVPEILQESAGNSNINLDYKYIDYIDNNSFSFSPNIIARIKHLDIELVRSIFNLAREILEQVKEKQASLLEISREELEMRKSVSILNKEMLSHYAREDKDKAKDLLTNIRKFFSRNNIDFYTMLGNISHPTLTKYLYSRIAGYYINQQVSFANDNTSIGEIENQVTTIINYLIDGLEKKHRAGCKEEIASSKRRSEITEIIKNALLTRSLSVDSETYVTSNAFKKYIDDVIDDYEFNSDLGNNSDSDSDDSDASTSSDWSVDVMSEDEEDDIGINIDDDDLMQLSPSKRVYIHMSKLENSLKVFKQWLISSSGLIITNHHSLVLKDILEDEKSIKFEKYLLLSKKYFPVFKKMFPEIGTYEMSVIARGGLPSFSRIRLPAIMPIFAKMTVNIIGDEQLQQETILNNDLIKLKIPVRFLSIGFGYKSVLKTFPFIFADEYEHVAKYDTKLGVKLFNTKGGYMEEKTQSGIIERQHINSTHVDTDDLSRFADDRQYLYSKEVCDLLSSPYKSGWVEFITKGKINTDIDFTFVVDKPYPASILKVYAKTKLLPHYVT